MRSERHGGIEKWPHRRLSKDLVPKAFRSCHSASPSGGRSPSHAPDRCAHQWIPPIVDDVFRRSTTQHHGDSILEFERGEEIFLGGRRIKGGSERPDRTRNDGHAVHWIGLVDGESGEGVPSRVVGHPLLFFWRDDELPLET